MRMYVNSGAWMFHWFAPLRDWCQRVAASDDL